MTNTRRDNSMAEIGEPERRRVLEVLAQPELITPIVSSPRRRRTNVIWVGNALLTVSRRPALVHRIVAAIIVAASPHAKGISRIISLSPGVPCC